MALALASDQILAKFTKKKSWDGWVHDGRDNVNKSLVAEGLVERRDEMGRITKLGLAYLKRHNINASDL